MSATPQTMNVVCGLLGAAQEVSLWH